MAHVAMLLKMKEKACLDGSELKTKRARGMVDVDGAVQAVDVVVAPGMGHLPSANSADMALPLDVGIGTIAVEAAAGSAVEEGRGSIGAADSRGRTADGAKTMEGCMPARAVFGHYREV